MKKLKTLALAALIATASANASATSTHAVELSFFGQAKAYIVSLFGTSGSGRVKLSTGSGRVKL